MFFNILQHTQPRKFGFPIRGHIYDLELADPNPASRQPIHLLIGADLYGSLLMSDLRQGPPGTPTAQRTALGWIISGWVSLRTMRT